MRLYLSKKESIYKTKARVKKQIVLEKKWGIKNIKKYFHFKKIVDRKISKIKKIVFMKYLEGYNIGCFTASSKGNTLLNSLNLNNSIISYVSENNIKKIGKYTPGTHIKIVSDKNFIKKKIDFAILLSWNYKKFFLKKSEFIKKGGKFIIPLPNPHIVN